MATALEKSADTVFERITEANEEGRKTTLEAFVDTEKDTLELASYKSKDFYSLVRSTKAPAEHGTDAQTGT